MAGRLPLECKLITPKSLAAQREGFLNKTGEGFSLVRKRLFMLTGSTLFYFKDYESANPLGMIRLPGCKIKEIRDEAKGRWGFTIESVNRVYLIFTDIGDPKEDIKGWLRDLKRVAVPLEQVKEKRKQWEEECSQRLDSEKHQQQEAHEQAEGQEQEGRRQADDGGLRSLSSMYAQSSPVSSPPPPVVSRPREGAGK